MFYSILKNKTFIFAEGSRMENSEKDCCICGSTVTLFQVKEKWICEQCLSIGDGNRTSLWAESIENLIKEYTEACYRCLNSDEPNNINVARILGRKIQSVLLFLGLPKKHTLLLPIKKVHFILNTIKETDVLLDEIAEQNEENKVNAEMVQIFTKKQKNANDLLTKNLPKLINDSYVTNLKNFVNEKLNYYNLPYIQEKALRKYEERFNELINEFNQSVEIKGKTSQSAVKILYKIRKKAKSLSYIYGFLNDMLGEQYMEKEMYYKDIQHQIAKVNDMKDYIDQLKIYEKKIHAPKKEKTAIKNKLKERMNGLIENVELDSVIEG
jgi:CHAD domain-containing protein/ribosomal protein S27AE